MKKTWSVIILLAVIGTGMMTAGYTLGASTSIYADRRGLHISKRENVKETANETSSVITKDDIDYISDIEIDSSTLSIEIIEADKYKLEITSNNEDYPITYTLNNGKLKIEQETPVRIMNFGSFSIKEDTAKIYIPVGTDLDNIEIKITSGEVNINDISCSDLDLKLSSGRVTVKNTTSDNLSLVCTSGSVTFKDCYADDFDLHMTSGTLKASGIKSGEYLTLKMTSGNATLEGEFLGSSKIKLTSGNANITAAGREQDYTRDVSVTSGNVFVNGVSNKSDYNSGSAKNNIDIDITSGNVNLDFRK